MITIAATEARMHLGQHMSKAQNQPVMITRPGQEPIVMISKKEYDILEALDNAYWYQKAMEAHEEGYASKEDVKVLIEKFKNA